MGSRRPACPGLWKTPVIRWDGRLNACCADVDGEIEVGSLHDHSFEELWEGPLMTQYRLWHIQGEFERGQAPYVAYQFPRMVNYLGKWIRHGEWYPDVKLRLFLKDKGYSGGQEPHDQVIVSGPVKTLKSHLWHYTYDDIHDHLETMNRYSTITAQEKHKTGSRFRWIDFLFRPPFRFFKAYILRQGFLDGKRGFLIAIISSFGVCMKYAKLWELHLRDKKNKS